MTSRNAQSLLQSVNTLLRIFTVDEQQYPSAEGRMRYNPLDFQTLRYLADYPDTSAADVARFLGVVPTTQQAVMDRLVKQGLVERTPHPTSKRSKAHRLTETGNDMLSAIIRQDLANMNTMLSALSPEEQDEIVRMLEKITSAVETL